MFKETSYKHRNLIKRVLILLIAPLFLIVSCKEKPDMALAGNLAEMSSEPGDIFAVFEFLDYGEVTFKLFPEVAPEAVNRFVQLAERGYYTKRNIHRVLKDFFFQGGSVNFNGFDGTVQEGEYFDVEISDYAKHFYGALCFAPNSEGKNYRQFYVVTNKNPVDINADIEHLEAQLNDPIRVLSETAMEKYGGYLEQLKAIPEPIKEQYLSRGGVYDLDGKDTVFGHVTEGQEVIDEIANAVVVSGNVIDDDNDKQSKPLDEIILEKVTIIRIPIPEPTTETSEETTKKTRKARATTAAPDSPDALTDKVNFGEETTTIPGEEGEVVTDENSPDDTSSTTETELPAEGENTEISETVEENN